MTSPGQTGPAATSGKSRWADLVPRLISAAVIVAVIATALYFGGWVYAALMAVIFGVLYREWEQMVTLRPLVPFGMALIGLLALAALAFPLYGVAGTAAVMGVAVLLSLGGGRQFAVWRAGGLFFFAVAMVAVLTMRGWTPLGIVAGWYLGLVIALNDTGAFFTGRLVGGPKLAPTISPAKTQSGAIGGLVAGTVAGTIFWLVFVPSPWWIGLILSILTGVVGQAGDLAESAVKRLFRVKDSGDFIPGHGGFMDRLDSVSFGALFLFAVGALHSGIDNVAGGLLQW
ncbi:MAG: phosphatidate cytidylyltransferase [Devosia sp.]